MELLLSLLDQGDFNLGQVFGLDLGNRLVELTISELDGPVAQIADVIQELLVVLFCEVVPGEDSVGRLRAVD